MPVIRDNRRSAALFQNTSNIQHTQPTEVTLTRALSRSACALCAAVLSLFFLSCDNNNPAGTPSPTELEGNWSGYIEGNPGITVGLEIQGNIIIYTYEGTELYRGTITLNTSEAPKQMDAYITQAQNTVYVGTTSLAIYRLSGDTLTVAGNEPGNAQRPASFTASGGTVVMVLIKLAAL
jgi:uncharacterized protein (TIGR03067 family)